MTADNLLATIGARYLSKSEMRRPNEFSLTYRIPNNLSTIDLSKFRVSEMRHQLITARLHLNVIKLFYIIRTIKE